MSDGDKKIFNLKRTGCGFPYSFPIIQDYTDCDALDYVFYLNPLTEPVLYYDYIEVSVTGGVGPFTWSIEGTFLKLVYDETEERTNIVYSPKDTNGSDALLTVVDSCGNERTGVVHWCNDLVNGKGSYEAPIETYDTWVKSGSYSAYSYSLAVFNDKLYMGHTDCRLIEWNDLSSSSYVTPIGSNAGKYITDLIVFNDKLYGTRNDGRLLEWNGTDDWIARTSNYESTDFIPQLVVHNGSLYASYYNPGRLMKWDGVSAWILVATYSGSTPYITSIVSNDTTIFLGDNSNDGVNYFSARLFQWDGADGLELVANGWGIDYVIESLAWFKDKIYGGTSPNGKLLEWNGVDAWTEVAPMYSNQTHIRDLLVAGGRLFGSTGSGYVDGYYGKLLEWNETDAWILRAGSVYGVDEVPRIRLLNGRIYGTSGWQYVYLLRWGE